MNSLIVSRYSSTCFSTYLRGNPPPKFSLPYNGLDEIAVKQAIEILGMDVS